MWLVSYVHVWYLYFRDIFISSDIYNFRLLSYFLQALYCMIRNCPTFVIWVFIPNTYDALVPFLHLALGLSSPVLAIIMRVESDDLTVPAGARVFAPACFPPCHSYCRSADRYSTTSCPLSLSTLCRAIVTQWRVFDYI